MQPLLALRLADFLQSWRERRTRPPVVVVRLAPVSGQAKLKVPALVVSRGASGTAGKDPYIQNNIEPKDGCTEKVYKIAVGGNQPI